MYRLSDYHYDLPEALIAQYPMEKRDTSRLMCLDRTTGAVAHRRFGDIVELLGPTDLMVVNNTAVVPARLKGKKATGGKIELLLLNWAEARRAAGAGNRLVCRCLIKASKRPKTGAELIFGPELRAEVIAFDDGVFTVTFACTGDMEKVLQRIGTVPLPPYIRRKNGQTAPCDDRTAYQTVYATQKGAVAAPTAGLHFSPELLGRLRAKGIEIVPITLHVGYGTFLPVRVDDIRAHNMHGEHYTVDSAQAAAVNRAKRQGRRVVAVGTTCVRTLEHVTGSDGRLTPGNGSCELFIYPGYRFKTVDAMLTNFHLPESTLLMLVSAFAGRKTVLSAYKEAVRQRYRFFSYGDAMLIE